MASLKDTKRRISSVRSTQKITRAMKLVASAKYARAQQLYKRAQIYQQELAALTGELFVDVPLGSKWCESPGGDRKSLLILISSDRGLCGGYNASLFKEVDFFIKEHKRREFFLKLWGRKAKQFATVNKNIVDGTELVLEKPQVDFARQQALQAIAAYQRGEYSSVYIAYSSFESALSQPPVIKKILPLSTELSEKQQRLNFSQAIFEPQKQIVLDLLCERYCVSQFWSILLEASVAEQAARMTAMNSATNNADKVIKDLTLEYNRARQAAITKELIEITSGAEALNS
jgi:F-type H+-transporting ATPase subunit gamma